MVTLLAVIPHPDDESYSFGGMLTLAVRAGWRVVVACASRGERGQRHDGAERDRQTLGPVREAELRESCSRLGVMEVECRGLPDGTLRGEAAGPVWVREVFEAVAPDVVVTLGPDGAYGHPDHRAVYDWVTEAWGEMAEGSRPVLLLAAFPRGLFVPQWEKCLPGGMFGEPPSPRAAELGTDTWHYEVEVSPVAEAKRSAVAAHRTQLPGGEPEALFPPGIVAALMVTERFVDADGECQPTVAQMLAELGR